MTLEELENGGGSGDAREGGEMTVREWAKQLMEEELTCQPDDWDVDYVLDALAPIVDAEVLECVVHMAPDGPELYPDINSLREGQVVRVIVLPPEEK